MTFPAFIFATTLILVLPLTGIMVSDGNIAVYLEFPPRPLPLSHPPFSIAVFMAISLFCLIAVLPFIKKAITCKAKPPLPPFPFPWWGYAALFSLVCCWVLAWTRLEWMKPVQPHTFFPLWLSFIVFINAIAFRRSGKCPLLSAPARFAILFMVSAAFWWIFEYLNRFVGNWIYTGSQYSAPTYFILATVSFSTVLPAVESVKTCLMTVDRFRHAFKRMPPLQHILSAPSAAGILILSSFLLSFIGVFPSQLFPLVWICPFLIFFCIRLLTGSAYMVADVKQGNYTLVAAYAAAALVCGFFWELFNFYSLARWQYHIPYVQVLHIFEMPLLGYAGYLPFGLECALIIDLVMKLS